MADMISPASRQLGAGKASGECTVGHSVEERRGVTEPIVHKEGQSMYSTFGVRRAWDSGQLWHALISPCPSTFGSLGSQSPTAAIVVVMAPARSGPVAPLVRCCPQVEPRRSCGPCVAWAFGLEKDTVAGLLGGSRCRLSC